MTEHHMREGEHGGYIADAAALWRQANDEHPRDTDARRARYLDLMREHGLIVKAKPGENRNLPCGWPGNKAAPVRFVHGCPNQPPCAHPFYDHDIDSWDDPWPTCCVADCACGQPVEPAPVTASSPSAGES